MDSARLSSFVAHLAAAFIVTGLSSLGAQADPPPFELMADYYNRATGGWIYPTSVPPAPGSSEEDWFKIDISRFTNQEKATDFLEAKRSFYRRLDFDSKTQKHEQPYEYLPSWRSNFHPPIYQLPVPIAQIDSGFSTGSASSTPSRFFEPEFQRDLDQVSGTELTFGNELDLLPNQKSFAEKLRMVRDAKKSFFGAVMVFFCDDSTRILMNEMIRKKKSGVDVRIIVEGLWGTTVASKCLKPMRKAGIPVLLIADFWKAKSRPSVMHHKIWIRDGEEAIIGGQNMHENSNYATGFNGRTRDTDMIIRQGPAVTDLMREYALLWQKYTKGSRRESIRSYLNMALDRTQEGRRIGVRGDTAYQKLLSQDETRLQGACRILVQGSGAEYQPIAPVLLRYIHAAQSRILFTSPSVNYHTAKPGKSPRWPQILADQLKEKASLDQVRIDALSNGIEAGSGELGYIIQRIQTQTASKNIPLLPWLLQSLRISRDNSGARKGREKLLDLAKTPNIRSWTYPEFTHQKVWYFDRLVASVGSVNFDDYSTHKSHESTAICMDSQLNRQIEAQLALDLANSVPVVSANNR